MIEFRRIYVMEFERHPILGPTSNRPQGWVPEWSTLVPKTIPIPRVASDLQETHKTVLKKETPTSRLQGWINGKITKQKKKKKSTTGPWWDKKICRGSQRKVHRMYVVALVPMAERRLGGFAQRDWRWLISFARRKFLEH